MSTEAKNYNSRNADKFVVRLPEGMRKRIAEVAKNYHRSMNSEIVSRLESSLRGEPCIQYQFEDESAEISMTDETSNENRIQLDLTQDEFTFIEQVRRLPERRRTAILELLTGLN